MFYFVLNLLDEKGVWFLWVLLLDSKLVMWWKLMLLIIFEEVIEGDNGVSYD